MWTYTYAVLPSSYTGHTRIDLALHLQSLAIHLFSASHHASANTFRRQIRDGLDPSFLHHIHPSMHPRISSATYQNPHPHLFPLPLLIPSSSPPHPSTPSQPPSKKLAHSPSAHQSASIGCSLYTGYGFSVYVFHSATPTTRSPISVSTTLNQRAVGSSLHSRIWRSRSSMKPAGVGSWRKSRQIRLGGVA